NVQALRFFPIDGHHILRIARRVSGEKSGKIFAFGPSPNQVVSHLIQILQSVIALVLKLILKSAKLSKPLHRRRLEDNHDRSRNTEQRPPQPLNDGGSGVLASLALRVRLQRQKHEARVGRRAPEAEPGDRKRPTNFRNVLGDGRDLLAYPPRIVERSSRGSLNHHDQISLVFGRYESLRHLPKNVIGETESGGKQNERHDLETQEQAQSVNVAVVDRAQHAIDALEEPVLFPVFAPQQQRRQRRRQRQRVESGNGDREGDGQRELPKQNSRGAREEGNRNENGHQHQRSRDNRSRNLLHRVRRGFHRIQLAFLQMAFDVFDHHDRVVYDQARGQCYSEQSQRVDRETQQLDERKRADQRHRNRHGRNDRRTPVFEKNKDDEDHQNNGRPQSKYDVTNRFAHRIRGHERDLIFHSRRKALREAVQFGNTLLMHDDSVGGRELRDRNSNRFPPVVIQVVAIVLGAKFGMPHIFQPDQRAIGIALENDVVELSRFGKTSHGAHADLELLPGHRRLGADLSRRNFDVLLAQRIHHVIRGKSAPRHPPRIEPQPHRVLALAKKNDVGHSRHPLEVVAHINIQVVADKKRRVSAIRREYRSAKNKILRRLGDGHSHLLDCIRKPSLSSIDAVLDVNRSQIRIPVDIERGGDRTHSIVRARRSYVFHPLSPVDLLFQRRRHGRFHRLRTGSRIHGGHRNLGRRQIRKLRNRECGNTDRARKNDQQGAD